MSVPASYGDAGYTSVAKLLHWTMAALLAVQFAIAWSMPHIGQHTVPEELINLHFSLGVLLLGAAAVRLAWSRTHPEPAPLVGVPRWEVNTARTVHGLLYVLLFVLPILGWMNASYRGFEVSFFGLLPLPYLLPPHAAGFGWTGSLHTVLSNYGLTGAVGLHVLAVIYHAVVRKDRVLQRMLPAGR